MDCEIRKPAIVGRLLAALLALACVADLRGDDPPTQSETKSDWEQRAVQGWNVFVRPELQSHDPKMVTLLKKLWGTPE
jgi:hypothetical protein